MKKAFTLAEVLITLAVIGAVAALTIPSLMRSNQKQLWIVRYKETYSIINQATRMIMADNGGTLDGVWDDVHDMYLAYLPHFKTIKLCENQEPLGNCFASVYTDLNNDETGVGGLNSIVLSNGASLNFEQTGMTGFDYIRIDTNGKKGPNTQGKDLQGVMIISRSDLSNEPVLPMGWGDNEEGLNNDCPPDLGSGLGGVCGIRILRGDYAEDY